MEFWQVYQKESLSSPWLIAPQQIENNLQTWPDQSLLFVIEPTQDPELLEMAQKMRSAIKLTERLLAITEVHPNDLANFKNDVFLKKMIFFGSDYPGLLGEIIHWQGHQVMKTYSLMELQNHPELKKETWSHLKQFAGL